MKSLSILFFLLSLSFAGNSFQFFVKAGGTNSSFQDSRGVAPAAGYLLGIGADFALPLNFSISKGFDYLTRASILYNKIVAPRVYMGEFPDGRDVFLTDIHFRALYYEIPILLNYTVHISHDLFFKVLSGYTYSMPHKDLTNINEKDYLFTDVLNSDYHYSYYKSVEPALGNYVNAYTYTLGLELKYKKIGLNMRYDIDKRGVVWGNVISEIYKKLHSLQISLISYF